MQGRVPRRPPRKSIEQRLAREYPNPNPGTGVWLISLDEWTVGDVRLPMLIFMAAVGFVLLIAWGMLLT